MPARSCVITGSTGSGMSEGELVDLLRLAGRQDCSVVLLDGLSSSAAAPVARREPCGVES